MELEQTEMTATAPARNSNITTPGERLAAYVARVPYSIGKRRFKRRAR